MYLYVSIFGRYGIGTLLVVSSTTPRFDWFESRVLAGRDNMNFERGCVPRRKAQSLEFGHF